MKQKLVKWLKDQVAQSGTKGCVFGLSGGLDSSVVGVLCQQAFPDNCLGLLLPCLSNEDDLQDGQVVAQEFAIPTKLIDLQSVFKEFYSQLAGQPYNPKENNLAIANIKPRLRMISLYYWANKMNYLVIGTGNRSEAAMGYCTKYGDAGVDLLPLASLLKTQVRQLAKELGVPEQIITKPPSAGLWSGQTDEDEMGITYDQLDEIIVGLEQNELAGLDPQLVDKVKNKMAMTEHKRCLPPFFKP
jgi:NAD+ synthase